MSKRFAWARMGFELEGLVSAFGFWLVGVLTGIFWGPLFWIGFIGAIVCLLGSRKSSRTSPNFSEAIVAPCDGVVADVRIESAPAELRLSGHQRQRIRISTSPVGPIGIHAPMAGAIETLVREEGDPSRFLAFSADDLGLNVAYLTVSSGELDTGCRVATGGLGPRLELGVELGDAVRIGQMIAKRRLGGWCDIYLPEGHMTSFEPGMSLIGGESILSAAVPASEYPPAIPDKSEIFEIEPDVEEVDIPPEREIASDQKEEDVAKSVAKLRENIQSSED